MAMYCRRTKGSFCLGGKRPHFSCLSLSACCCFTNIISDFTWTQFWAFSVRAFSASITMAMYCRRAKGSFCLSTDVDTSCYTCTISSWLACSLSCSALRSSSLCRTWVSNSTNRDWACQGEGQGRDLVVLSDWTSLHLYYHYRWALTTEWAALHQLVGPHKDSRGGLRFPPDPFYLVPPPGSPDGRCSSLCS